MELIERITKERLFGKSKAELVKEAVAAIDEVDKVLNVLEEKVAPYGYYIPMREIIDSARDFERYTGTSQSVLIEELNGCIDIVNYRIRNFNEKDVQVRILVGANAGKIKVYKESTADEFIEMGWAEAV